MTAPTVGDVLRERAAAGRLLRLYYERDMQPTHWIAEDEDGALFEFPAEVGGWRQRLPYTGERESLTETPAYNAIGTGWPGVLPPRPPVAKCGPPEIVRPARFCGAV